MLVHQWPRVAPSRLRRLPSRRSLESAVDGALAPLGPAQCAHMIDGYESLPPAMQRTLLSAAVSKMGSVTSIRRASVLGLLRSSMDGCASAHWDISYGGRNQLSGVLFMLFSTKWT